MFAVGAEGPEPRYLDQDHSNFVEASGVEKIVRKTCRRIVVERELTGATYIQLPAPHPPFSRSPYGCRCV